MPGYTNQLIYETSPYLLQHSHNPVNWYPWGEAALKAAKEQNKPILVSIGYAACHWCHVMERESFEDEATALVMNENFINIKIDREERPDLDHIYMDAVQAMTGSGGWPLNVFLTPGGKPFFGGTYFPPKRAFNRASWTEVLLAVSKAFSERRSETDEQAENLTAHLVQSNSFGLRETSGAGMILSSEKPEKIFQNIMQAADREWGGFGKAPKFPQTFIIQFLLRYYYVSGNNEALDQALLSLDKMIEGGIYDQVGGGFARYSTDTEWLVPHFEKMLYDNALLISVLSEAYQLTHKKKYSEVIHQTMEFVGRELLHNQKGFFSSLDADSEGEEGKFYTWTLAEIKELLGKDAELFCSYYNITEPGNWEQKNILRVRTPFEKFSEVNNIPGPALEELLENGRKKILEQRNKRIRPMLDDKVILSWNALMNMACSKAYMATGQEDYRKLAVENMNFLLTKFRADTPEQFGHVWKNDKLKHPAFLDDYAFLIQALICLQEITADTKWLTRADELTQFVIDHFSDPGAGFFYYTQEGQQDVIMRKREVYDGAVPSANSVMAYNLYRLSFYFDKKEWKERSLDMLASLEQAILTYPTSFGTWACLLLELVSGTFEIVIAGKNYESLKNELLGHYLPHSVLISSAAENQQFSLLEGKIFPDNAVIYLCKDFVCQQPVDTIARFMSLINRHKNGN